MKSAGLRALVLAGLMLGCTLLQLSSAPSADAVVGGKTVEPASEPAVVRLRGPLGVAHHLHAAAHRCALRL